MKVLHLTLKKKWFDMIAAGEKEHEYREIKPYWTSRLVKYFADPLPDEDFNFEYKGLKWTMAEPEPFAVVEFKNGYAKDSPVLKMAINSITMGYGKSEWGAEIGKPYFVISLRPLTP